MTRGNIVERRRALVRAYASGRLTGRVYEEIAKTNECTKEILRQDWHRRGSWIESVFPALSKEGRETGDDLLLELMLIRQGLWQTFYAAQTVSNSNGAVGAARSITDNIIREMEMRQSLGKLHEEPLRVLTGDMTEMQEKFFKPFIEIIGREMPENLPKIAMLMEQYAREAEADAREANEG